MSYIENPKTKGSGVICCIPQSDPICPNKCADCFYGAGRSYLEPLSENLPNIPPAELAEGRVVRVNDGNDSNIDRDLVIESTAHFKDRFFNTAIPKLDFPAPVVLTVNPGGLTDKSFHKVKATPNLMFVRARVNTWNLALIDSIVKYYTGCGVPIILTFLAFFQEPIPENHRNNYRLRKRTLNKYQAITTLAWESVMARYKRNALVHSCGLEGEYGTTACRHCGNCLREYYATRERITK